MRQPSPKTTISREEIRAVYAQGEDAMIALVEGLFVRIATLEARIEALENQQQKDSQTSSKPPSSDGFGKRTRSLRTKSGRKSGGQKGHPGNTLEWRDEVDEIETHRVSQCQGCGASLESVEVLSWDVRQVHDLPPMRLVVRDHQAEVKCCLNCGVLNRGEFPVGVSNVVQYGSGVKSLLVYLSEYQLLPSERVCQLMQDVLGYTLSEGTLSNSRVRCFEQLAEVSRQIKAGMQGSAVGHFDETGLRVNGKLWWLHVASSEFLTDYFVHPKRGQVAMTEMAVLPQFQGISVQDGWSSYAHYDCDHALCNAHHLRELRFIWERYQQPWADQMMELLIEIKAQVEQAQSEGQAALSAETLQDFEQRYHTLVTTGLAANPPTEGLTETPRTKGRVKQSPARNLLDRLHRHQSHVLAFMHDFRVPFDNNQAERDLRMMKLKQKISGGFRSETGAQIFCRIRGYLSTLKKQGLDLLEALRQTFRGCPLMPALQPE